MIFCFFLIVLIVVLLIVGVGVCVGIVGEIYCIVYILSVVLCDVQYSDILCVIVWYFVVVGLVEMLLQIGLLGKVQFDVGSVVVEVLFVLGWYLVIFFLYGFGGSV